MFRNVPVYRSFVSFHRRVAILTRWKWVVCCAVNVKKNNLSNHYTPEENFPLLPKICYWRIDPRTKISYSAMFAPFHDNTAQAYIDTWTKSWQATDGLVPETKPHKIKYISWFHNTNIRTNSNRPAGHNTQSNFFYFKFSYNILYNINFQGYSSSLASISLFLEWNLSLF